MKLSARGLALIKEAEGFRAKAYLCPANVWTIGYGHTEGVKSHHVVTPHQADVLLEHDVERFEAGVMDLTAGLVLTQGQFDALVSFAFNLGLTALANSTLLKKLQRGDAAGAAEQFGRWVNAGGRRLPGLEKRRAAEAALFLS